MLKLSSNDQAKQDKTYHQTSNISHILVGNKIVDHSDVVGASPVFATPATSSFSTEHLASMVWAKNTAKQGKNHVWDLLWLILEIWR